MVKLLESPRAVFPVPSCPARDPDACGRQDREVEFGRPDSPNDAATSLFDGNADVTRDGPIRMAPYQDRPGEGMVAALAEAVMRDLFHVVEREPRPDCGRISASPISWRRVSAGFRGAPPRPCLQDDSRPRRPPPNGHARPRGMAETAEALREGRVGTILSSSRS